MGTPNGKIEHVDTPFTMETVLSATATASTHNSPAALDWPTGHNWDLCLSPDHKLGTDS